MKGSNIRATTNMNWSSCYMHRACTESRFAQAMRVSLSRLKLKGDDID